VIFGFLLVIFTPLFGGKKGKRGFWRECCQEKNGFRIKPGMTRNKEIATACALAMTGI